MDRAFLQAPAALAALRLVERVSLRPKTAAVPILALGGLGLAYSASSPLPPRDRSRKNREPMLWDFYDPQGHHRIHWNN